MVRIAAFLAILAAAAPAFGAPLSPRELDRDHLAIAAKWREDINRWNSQLSQLNDHGKKKVLKDLNDLAEKWAKWEGTRLYDPATGDDSAQLVAWLIKAAWDENVERINLRRVSLKDIQKESDEVDKEFKDQLKHHHARDAAATNSTVAETETKEDKTKVDVKQIVKEAETKTLVEETTEEEAPEAEVSAESRTANPFLITVRSLRELLREPLQEHDAKDVRHELKDAFHDLGVKDNTYWIKDSDLSVVLNALEKYPMGFDAIDARHKAKALEHLQKAEVLLRKFRKEYKDAADGKY